MKLRFRIFVILFFIINSYLTQVFCFGPGLTNPTVEVIQNVGLRIGVVDPSEFYDNVAIAFKLECGEDSKLQGSNHLQFEKATKEWVYKSDKITKCQNGFLNYKLKGFYDFKNKEFPGLVQNINDKITNTQSQNNDPNYPYPISNAIESTTTFNPIKIKTTPQASICEHSETTIDNNHRVCKGDIIFEDTFSEMNWTKWNRDIRIPLDTDDAEFVSFQDFAENLYIKNKVLYILPKLLTEYPGYDIRTIRMGQLDLGSKCTGIVNHEEECIRNTTFSRILPPIVSARINTRNKFTFKYGVIEIRAKLPKGDWLFPQLFLEPLNSYGTSGYSSGQIRLAFIRGNELLDSKDSKQIDGFRLLGGVILAQGEKYRETWLKDTLSRNHFGDNYHVYKTIWTNEFMSFEVDGKEYGTLNNNFSYEAFDLNGILHAKFWKNDNKLAPFDKEFFLSIGLSAGGISDFPDKSFSGKRDYQQKPWNNLDTKNELNFWKAKDWWHSTWKGETAALKIDYIRIWAL